MPQVSQKARKQMYTWWLKDLIHPIYLGIHLPSCWCLWKESRWKKQTTVPRSFHFLFLFYIQNSGTLLMWLHCFLFFFSNFMSVKVTYWNYMQISCLQKNCSRHLEETGNFREKHMKQLLVRKVCWLYEVLVFFKSAHLWNFFWFSKMDVNVQGNDAHIGFVLFCVLVILSCWLWFCAVLNCILSKMSTHVLCQERLFICLFCLFYYYHLKAEVDIGHSWT